LTVIMVTGIGGPAGRSVASLLLERKLEVVGTDMRELTPPGIRFFQVPPANSPEFLASVRAIAATAGVDWIIPTVSEELPVFARGWEWQAELPVLVSTAEAVAIADDKYLTATCLSSHGVSVPRFALPSQVHSPQEVARQIGWPCISKPRVGRGGREVVVHYEPDWPAVAGLDDRSILQEFAAGTDYAPNVFAGPDGKTVVVVLEKTELKDGLVGNAAQVRRVEAPDVADLAAAAARAAGLSGPLDIDIRRRSDGTPVVLEINARFGANIRQAPEILDAALAAGGKFK
jgi:carbamoylphosphate synthase large subunit